jgi:hypothetical protein
MMNKDCDEMFYDDMLELLGAPTILNDFTLFDDFSDYSSEGLESEDSHSNVIVPASMPISNSRKRKSKDVDCLSDISSVSETTNKKRKPTIRRTYLSSSLPNTPTTWSLP